MYTAIVTILLSLLLTLFSSNVSDAAIWVCPQQDRGLLYTDELQTGDSCKKYEIVSQLNYAPPQILPNPYSEMTPDKAPAKDPEVLQESRSEETNQALDSRRKNKTEENSLFDETPTLAGVYTYMYTYVPRSYGIPFPRYKDGQALPNGPQRHHESKDRSTRESSHESQPEMKQDAFVQSHLAPTTASTPRHENSVRAIPPALAPSAPPMPSTHAQGSSARSVAAGPAHQGAPPTEPAPVRGIAPAAAASTGSQIMNDPPQRPSSRRFMPVEPRTQ